MHGEQPGTRLRLLKSSDGGRSFHELTTIDQVTTVGLAVNGHGRVGLLYQKLVAPPNQPSQWETRFWTQDEKEQRESFFKDEKQAFALASAASQERYAMPCEFPLTLDLRRPANL